MILVLNAGSSSLKVEVFDLALTSLLSGSLTNIGTEGKLSLGDQSGAVTTQDHAAALNAMGGVDAVAFTGGIGENAAPVRDQIMAHLSFLGDVDVHVIAADEEKAIARDALQLIEADA